MWQLKHIAFALFLTTLLGAGNLNAAELRIGTATADITPALPVALSGQFELRIAQTAATPLSANVVALESSEGGRSLDVAIMVSCDLVAAPGDLLALVRDEVHKRSPNIDVRKIFMNAIHTHTAPVLEERRISDSQGRRHAGRSYRALFVQRVSEAITQAWNARRPGSVTWGLSHAVVGNNRRAVYANGSSKMYGETNSAEFLSWRATKITTSTPFFWNQDGKLIATIIEVACPAQEVESDTVNADFWHPVRVALRERYGADLCVLGMVRCRGRPVTAPDVS